jgi:hypothetical protein
MKCFSCQKDKIPEEKFIPVNIGQDCYCKGVGDIHVIVCSECCEKIIKAIKGIE